MLKTQFSSVKYKQTQRKLDKDLFGGKKEEKCVRVCADGIGNKEKFVGTKNTNE
jgi:hypothetical protein